DLKSQRELLLALAGAHNGVYRMSPEIEGLVEASNNIANVTVKDGEVHIKCLTRSSVESSKDDLAGSLKSVFELAGFEVKLSGEYPGWAPNSDSAILKTLDKIYQEMYGEKADIAACHAGLECGIIGSHYPNMDMISFGPTIRGAHSPDERASVSSAQKYWKFLLEVLKNIPEN
ncbi:MAG: M20/M25/M40 family metallo-hydrolase, partial [Christiangramia sp.]